MNGVKKVIRNIWLASIVSLIWQQNVQAVQVNPFFARVAVNDRTAESLESGQARALNEVLIKLTGRPELVRGAVDPTVLARAPGMLETYRFVSRPNRTLLEAHFDPAAVQSLAAELELPVWPLERAVAVTWIAFDEGEGRQLLGTSPEHTALAELVNDAAEANAIPIIVPDVAVSSVTANTVWGGFVDRLRGPSSTYSAPLVLAGRIYAQGNSWRSSWTLGSESGEQLRWSSQGSDAEQVLQRGFAQMASRLAQRYAQSTSINDAGGRLTLRVYGVDSPERYGQVMKYLNDLSVVRRADIALATPEYLDLELESTTGAGGLTRLFQLEGLLVPSLTESPGADAAFEIRR